VSVASGIYQGRVTHARRGPKRHQFSYRIHMFYLDLDEVAGLLPMGMLRRGRFGWLSFWRADYLGTATTPLKTAVLDLVQARLGTRPSGPVRLLTQLRCLGYVFNPVSFYYCFAADGERLEAVVAEITNTPWKERHSYVLPATDGVVSSDFDKAFHVSPFFGMAQHYRWHLSTPATDLIVAMVNEEGGRPVFSATLALHRRELTAATLWRTALGQPLMAWRVHLGIYAHALALWLKRTPYFAHPGDAEAAAEKRT
jgi:DUF1365 family protein